MSLSDVELVNLSIGNTTANPYYPILTDDEVQSILDSVDGDVHLATKKAASNASFIVIAIPNREKIGDMEIWNEYSRNYLTALNNIITDDTYTLPKGLMPYAGGIDTADYKRNQDNPARHQSSLARVVENTKSFWR